MTVAEDFRNSIAALVKTIKERVEVGLVDPQDLLMAEVKLNEAEYQLLQAQSNFETGRMALNSMIGVRLEHHTELDSQIPVVVVDDSTWLSPVWHVLKFRWLMTGFVWPRVRKS